MIGEKEGRLSERLHAAVFTTLACTFVWSLTYRQTQIGFFWVFSLFFTVDGFFSDAFLMIVTIFSWIFRVRLSVAVQAIDWRQSSLLSSNMRWWVIKPSSHAFHNEYSYVLHSLLLHCLLGVGMGILSITICSKPCKGLWYQLIYLNLESDCF